MKKPIHPQLTALGGIDHTRFIISTIGDDAYIKNRFSNQLECWRRYKGDITKAPVMFIDGMAYVRVLGEKPGEHTLASTMIAA